MRVDLRLDEAVHRDLRVRERCRVPVDDDLALLRGGEQRQRSEGEIRIRDDGLQQALEVAEHALDRGAVEDVDVEIDPEAEPGGSVDGADHQIELRRRRRHGHRAGAHPRGRVVAPRCNRLQREHHLEQRRSAEIAIGREPLHQALEGEVLVRVAAETRLPHLLEQIAEDDVASRAGADDERVDEEADEIFDLAPGSVEHRGPDQDVGLPGIAMEHRVGGREQGHEQRHALTP